MSCSFCSEDDFQSLTKKDSSKNQRDLSHSSKCKKLKSLKESSLTVSPNTKFVDLPRGGCVVFTRIGPIQFGIPPETVKDCLKLGIEVPTYYILPSNKWDKIYNISVAEFEFPAYFNFFLKRKKINLICTKENAKAIKSIFQETLLGPIDFENFDEDFDESFDQEAKPDMKKELSYFAKNPFNSSEPLKIETLIEITVLDDNGFAYLPEGITIRKDEKYFVILDQDTEIAQIKDRVRIHIHDEEIEDYSDWKFGIMMNAQSSMAASMESSKFALYKENFKQPSQFDPPVFGVTVLGSSHGFDPKGNTSGYLVWINGRGIMVDPPPFSTHILKKKGITQNVIDWIIITHCHADHDAGAFQKILESSKVEVITTRTILGSFIRKYSSMVGLNLEEMSQLFKFRPVVIGAPLRFNGAVLNFFYNLHSIPCIGFTVDYLGKSIYFSADTYYDPEGMKSICEKGFITQKRFEKLQENIWNHDLIFHEAGVPPIHTPMKVLMNLPEEVKKRLLIVHAAEKDIPPNSGLRMAKTGLQHTISLDVLQKPSNLLNVLDVLCSIELFEKTNLRNVRDLMESAQEKKFLCGEMVCKEGTHGSEFFIILAGVVKIFSLTPERAFERYCQVGDYFGESALKGIKFSLRQAKNSLFCHLNSAQKIQMEMIMREKKIKKGEVLWMAGSKPQLAVLIIKGELEFFKCKEAEHEGFEIASGTFLGEIDAFLNDKSLSTNVRAVGDCEIFEIRQKELIAFLKNNPGLLLLLNKVKFIE